MMNEPLRLETVGSCLITPGLISLIESRAARHEHTFAHSLQRGLFCLFARSLWTVIHMDSMAEERRFKE